MYYNLGDPQQALDAWARALEINPNDQVARGNVEATNRES
jgi:tetratricopeptide (TPR) repeat protein